VLVQAPVLLSRREDEALCFFSGYNGAFAFSALLPLIARRLVTEASTLPEGLALQ
jgi:hypothetical protein